MKNAKLWEVLLHATNLPEYSHIIKWKDRKLGIFILVDSEEFASLYNAYKVFTNKQTGKKASGKVIKRSSIERGLRHYYEDKVVLPTKNKFKYQFGPLAHNWRQGVTRENAKVSLEAWELSKVRNYFPSHF